MSFIDSRENQRITLFNGVWRNILPDAFKDVSSYYDRGNQAASLGLYGWWVGKFVSAAALFIPPEAKLLDVCSGMHDVPFRLFEKDRSLKLYAIDKSPHMLAEGTRRAEERKIEIETQICDAHKLPFSDETFDVVTMQFASRHVQIDRVFREIHRVLKPGGIFCHNDLLRPTSASVRTLYYAFLRLTMRMTSVCFKSSDASKQCMKYFVDAIDHFYSPEEMSSVLDHFGFDVIATDNLMSGIFGYHIAQKR